jgi:DNA-binding HxlR family transcriptional regulator
MIVWARLEVRSVFVTDATEETGACPVAAFQKIISGKYKLRILWDLKDRPLRYSELRAGLLRGATGTKEIAPRVLSRELKALAETGLIARKDFHVVPPRVEYALTPMGRSFIPVVTEMRAWSHRYIEANALSMAGPGMAGAARGGGETAARTLD